MGANPELESLFPEKKRVRNPFVPIGIISILNPNFPHFNFKCCCLSCLIGCVFKLQAFCDVCWSTDGAVILVTGYYCETKQVYFQ
ncbi:hypothetical protein Hanom_Chr09g00823231 [Helianthus anomalus]